MNPRGNEEFHVTYIKSHTRFAAYLVGFYSGYLFVTYSKDGNLNRIKQVIIKNVLFSGTEAY